MASAMESSELINKINIKNRDWALEKQLAGNFCYQEGMRVSDDHQNCETVKKENVT